MTSSIQRRLLPAALAAATAIALAGCTFDAAEPTAAGAGASELDGLVKPGTLSVGVTLPDAPYMIADADNVPQSGITKDLLDAVAEELGLGIEFIPVAWEGGRRMRPARGASAAAPATPDMLASRGIAVVMVPTKVSADG